MDITQLYDDYSVAYVTEGHKHARDGWVNTECPWCTGNAGYHLGYELQNNRYYCWRCGWHPVVPTVARLIGLTERETRTIIRQYGLLVPHAKTTETATVRTQAHRMPTGVGPLQPMHREYLQKRGFDADELERTWMLVGTGPVGQLDGLDFKLRVIAPIVWDDVQVSFTARDITDKQPLRYITCPKNRELTFHKHIVYGKQEHWGTGKGICVEGPTDAWRMGVHSFATFGIKYTATQVRVMAKYFRRVAVCYDDDPQARVQAQKLVAELRFRGVDAFRVDITGDPGAMTQKDADYLVKQLMK